MIEVKNISHAYGEHRVLDDVCLRVGQGRVMALLGPNGAGKSTLLRVIAGELRPQGGTATMDGRALSQWKTRELARRRAFLPQDSQLEFPFAVEEVVMLGRAPHIEGSESDEDARIVREALALAGMETFAERDFTSLSGGERQRVQLARVLAQAWNRTGCVLLLDEPVASLDLAHQHDTLRIAREWAKGGACVVAILHDVNLALRYADDAVLIKDGRIVADGPVREVLTAQRVSEVFSVEAKSVEHSDEDPPVLVISGRARD
jgi:iron complex transport system ATP-binding protein